MAFRDTLNTFITDLETLIGKAEELPTEILARILHQKSVQVNAEAVTSALSVVAHVSVNTVKASADAIVHDIEKIVSPVASAPSASTPNAETVSTVAPVAAVSPVDPVTPASHRVVLPGSKS